MDLPDNQNDTCSQFHEYDFDADEDFQKGWSLISQKHNCAPDDILRAKLFYFSRKFKQLSLSEYKAWMKKMNCKVTTKEGNQERNSMDTQCVEDHTSVENHNREKTRCQIHKKLICHTKHSENEESSPSEIIQDNKGDKSTVNENVDSLCESLTSHVILNQKTESESNQDYSPSFGEVVDMLAKGLPLPGITDMNIQPLDINPAASSMEKVKKPWEQG